ncbi:MAG: autotransporter-associated beta strand repeat-containing protein [Pseudolabrys sp.]|nr:autotransporter-associated beta strand repeat-containing protein [Pseudolabrys sp.]
MPEAASPAASAFTVAAADFRRHPGRRPLAIMMDQPRPLRGSERIGRRLVSAGASIAVLMALSAGSATAQQWTGASSNDWTDGANWNGGTVPTSPSAVTINSSNPAVLGAGGAASGSTGNLFVGDTTSGSLTVQNGSTLTSLGSFRIGGGTGTGTVTVTGAGSQWTATGLALSVGGSGTGILNIQNGGTVTASGGVSLGNAGGVGTLNVSNATIASQSLNVGAGSQVNFDNATYRATRSSGVWIGTGPGTLNIAAGGLTLDSVGFTVSVLRELSGAGALTKTGTGILNLTTSNSYTGRTVIDQGTLALRANSSIAASSGVTANGTFDISAITPSGVDIQSLSGTGNVVLGAKTLTLTNANDTFAGAITGTGDLTILGGTQTLTGVSTYGGETNVRGTSSLRLLNGGQITGTSATTLDGPGVTAQVSGAGSLLQTGTLTFANGAGSNVTLDILDGGVVRTTGAGTTAIGSSATAVATVNVDGAGSRFEVTDGLGIGNVSAGTTAFLNVTNGGTVQSASGIVGTSFRSTATRAVTVSGAGSNWTMSGALNLRSGASLSVVDGGAVTAATSTIARVSRARPICCCPAPDPLTRSPAISWSAARPEPALSRWRTALA